ncbi:Hint domain-containing protein [Sphaerisporangium krabiense]|nr:Hint domain-containing protein [Sphaerisporangium krabiense]
MADGTHKPIEQVRVGDWVLTTDPLTGKTGPGLVLALIDGSGVKSLVQVAVDADPEQKRPPNTLTATDGHPFWVPRLGKWVTARMLGTGTSLKTVADDHAKLTAVRKWTAGARVYNLSVAGPHTYYVTVGTQDVLVHNSTPCWTPTGQPISKIPPEWGPGRPNKKGVGTRWQDPKNQGSGVRIDKGDPNNPQPTQQRDHVIVRDHGKVIGRNGKPIDGSIREHPEDAHIPFSEWSKWSQWNKP